MNAPTGSRGTPARRAATAAVALVVAACQAAQPPRPEAASVAPTAAIAATAPAPDSTALPTPPGTQVVGGPFVPPAAACAGQSAWTGVPALVIRLADAWHEPDLVARRAILDEVWGAESVYQDPFSDGVIGPDAFAEVMGYGVAPGQYIELRSWDPSDMHHGAIRLPWRHCCPSGLSLLEGTEIATIGADGRFSRIVSFWSRFVEEPAEGACDSPAVATPSPITAGIDEARCLGPDVDWSGIPTTAARYGQAWNERDPDARREILEEIWATDGSYVDPTLPEPVIGREAFVEHIDGFLAAGHGAYFQPLPMSEGDAHHGHLRMPWIYCDDDGRIVWAGDDVAELDADGRIIRDLGFFVP